MILILYPDVPRFLLWLRRQKKATFSYQTGSSSCGTLQCFDKKLGKSDSSEVVPIYIFYDGELKENALNVTDRFWTTMGIGNILLLSQVIAFLVSFLGSFFIFISVSINLKEFDGHCLLGAKGTWNFSSGNVMLMDIKWGLHSDCGFAIFIGIVVMILSVFFIVWQSVNLFKNTDRYIQLNHVNYFFQLIKKYFDSILMKCTSG